LICSVNPRVDGRRHTHLGGRIVTHQTPPRIAGGTVLDFALESTRHPVGLLFC
jgi:hypothetical protein